MNRSIALLVYLVLVVAQNATADPGALKPGEYITAGGWGHMKITRSAGASLVFDISAIGGNAHTCSLNGKIVGGRAVLEWSEADKPCIVSFQAVEKGVSVSENEGGCSYYCGARAGFTGL